MTLKLQAAFFSGGEVFNYKVGDIVRLHEKVDKRYLNRIYKITEISSILTYVQPIDTPDERIGFYHFRIIPVTKLEQILYT